MQVYLVGGAVRDRLLGLRVGDRDWVVVGAQPEELERLRSLSVEQQSLAGALTFVAKEAFFKCQYPLAAERFGFDVLGIDPVPRYEIRAGEQVTRGSVAASGRPRS